MKRSGIKVFILSFLDSALLHQGYIANLQGVKNHIFARLDQYR